MEDKALVENTPKNSVYRDLYQKMQTVYATCMDESQVNRTGIQSLEREIVDLLEVHQSSNLTEVIIFTENKSYASFTVQFIVGDDSAPTRRSLMLSQPSLTLEAVENYNDTKMVGNYTEIAAQYFESIIGKMNKTIIGKILPTGQSWKTVAQSVIDFEVQLAAISEKP